MATENTPILIVDDEEIVLLAISESLLPEGYRIERTTSPYEALELLRKQDFAVIISDHHMPGMTGLEFFAEANKIQPMASRILITGVLTLKVVVDAINKGEIFRFIAKPWIREELLATVKNATHRYELLSKNNRLETETRAINAELRTRNSELEAELKDLQARLRFRQDAYANAETHLLNALELLLRLVHHIDPDLAREARLVVALCQSMVDTGRIPTETASLLRLSSHLVALGKINVDRKRLRDFIDKPESLHGDELDYFHNIPVYSQLHAAQFELMPALSTVVRATYERVDGRGYPDGLTSTQIPEAARYLAIAVFYAESNTSTQRTLERIRELSGSAFSPEAVSLFFQASSGLPTTRKVRNLGLNELQPGMVIGEDIRFPSGAVLLPKGSSLSQSTLNMLLRDHHLESNKTRFLVYS